MKQGVVIVAALALLAGCAGTPEPVRTTYYEWAGRGAETSLDADSYACKKEMLAMQSPEMYQPCMAARGWRRVGR